MISFTANRNRKSTRDRGCRTQGSPSSATAAFALERGWVSCEAQYVYYNISFLMIAYVRIENML